jgi:heme exporter protein CcmD
MNDLYIWGSYSVTFALLALEVILLIRRARKCETKA